jgi:hypothetical protein
VKPGSDDEYGLGSEGAACIGVASNDPGHC